MQIHELRIKTGKKAKRVGRGGKRGKTSGRGTKGQNARAGRKKRPEMRDIIKKFPKLRGHGINRAKSVIGNKEKTTPVNLSTLDKYFEANETVNIDTLLEKGVVELKSGKKPKVKILAKGELSKALNVEGLAISQSAKDAIEKAGGSVK